jgi:regulatory protein
MPDNELFKTSMNKALTLCARRENCISEVLARLHSWGTDADDSTRIIEILKKDNFINEERFALGFVREKFNFNKWGKIKIAAHLKAKNISNELIKKALDTIDNDTYNKTLTNLLSAHRRSVKAKNAYDLKAKLVRYGLSKGFESSLLYDLLNEMED